MTYGLFFSGRRRSRNVELNLAGFGAQCFWDISSDISCDQGLALRCEQGVEGYFERRAPIRLATSIQIYQAIALAMP